MNVSMPWVRKPPGGVLLILDLVFGKNFGFILEKIFLSKIFSGASTARRLLICLAVRVPSGSLEERRHLFLGVASASPALHCWWCRGCVLLAFHCKRYSFGSMLRNRAAPFFFAVRERWRISPKPVIATPVPAGESFFGYTRCILGCARCNLGGGFSEELPPSSLAST